MSKKRNYCLKIKSKRGQWPLGIETYGTSKIMEHLNLHNIHMPMVAVWLDIIFWSFKYTTIRKIRIYAKISVSFNVFYLPALNDRRESLWLSFPDCFHSWFGVMIHNFYSSDETYHVILHDFISDDILLMHLCKW